MNTIQEVLDHVQRLYDTDKVKYIQALRSLTDDLERAVVQIEKNQFFGNALRTGNVTYISELYGNLSETYELIVTLRGSNDSSE
jgi:hypothetical protein